MNRLRLRKVFTRILLAGEIALFLLAIRSYFVGDLLSTGGMRRIDLASLQGTLVIGYLADGTSVRADWEIVRFPHWDMKHYLSMEGARLILRRQLAFDAYRDAREFAVSFPYWVPLLLGLAAILWSRGRTRSRPAAFEVVQTSGKAGGTAS